MSGGAAGGPITETSGRSARGAGGVGDEPSERGLQWKTYVRSYFFWTAILVVGTLVVMGYQAKNADTEYHYEDNSGATCPYYEIAVESGDMTWQEYYDMGCP
jgi:hypothetical protein